MGTLWEQTKKSTFGYDNVHFKSDYLEGKKREGKKVSTWF
jgi:hypothetical protein